MQDKFNQFQAKVLNQSIEVEDPSNVDQCMDLIFAWCDFLGIPREAVRHQFAYQVWQYPTPQTTQYFDMLQNTLTFIPQAGDIAVFGTKVGVAGHVSIDTGKSNVLNLNTLDQNWDTPHYNHGTNPQTGQLIPYTRLVTHAWYNGVLGFLRPKVAPQPLTDAQFRSKSKDVLNSSISPQDKVDTLKPLV